MTDLLLCLAAFTAWQTLLPPVSGRVAFSALLRRVRVRRGPRWTWLSCWPLAPGAVTAERALALSGGGLAPRFPRPGETRSALPVSALARARVRGRSVRAEGRVLCRCVTRHHAQRVAGLARHLAGLDAGPRAALLASLARAGLDPDAFACAQQRAAPALRALAWVSAASLVGAAAVGLAAVATRFEERILLAALPALALLHLANVVCVFRAHASIDGEDGEGRLEALFSSLLFPPAAWTAAQHLRCELASRFHPALTAGALLGRAHLLDFLRGELALLARACESPEADADERALVGVEREALLGLAAARGLSAAELALPRERADANAASYCVVCGSDYRPGFDWCGDCAVSTLAYTPSPAAGSRWVGPAPAPPGGGSR